MKKTIYKILQFVAVAVLCVVSATGGQFNLSALPVYAAGTAYSSVMEDLRKDSSFDSSYYPESESDYSVQVIQLAESVDKELFVYTYQPSGNKVTASSINISTTINDDISFYNYKLEQLSGSGTLFKYKVTNFTVKDETVRYYAISSVYRPFDKDVDKEASGDNTVTEVNYALINNIVSVR